MLILFCWQISSSTDMSHFDKFKPLDPSEIPPDDVSGWDEDFGIFSQRN